MEKHMIRLLRADEIECRVSVTRENGLSLLLYKDARVDQRILDETFGLFGWQRSHQCIDGNLYCTVSVYNKDTGCWISKQDVGTTGYAEKEKSQASDSFKRACFNWGIGRELYSAPFIWIPAAKASILQDKNKSRWYCNDHFSVQSIGYDEKREINALTIVNASNHGQTVYGMQANAGQTNPAQNGTKPGSKNPVQQTSGHSLSNAQMKSLEEELQRTGVGMDMVKERYRISQPEQMPEEIYRRVMAALAKTNTAA